VSGEEVTERGTAKVSGEVWESPRRRVASQLAPSR